MREDTLLYQLLCDVTSGDIVTGFAVAAIFILYLGAGNLCLRIICRKPRL